MTAAFAEAPARPVRPPHPSFAGLCWVTWRQHRTALLATLAVIAFAALALVYYGLQMHSDFASLNLAACVQGREPIAGATSLAAPHCSAKVEAFHSDQDRVNQLMALTLPLPLVFGLFIGAPLLAREYESGSYRFTFTQGAGRTRWLVTKIGVLTAFTLAATIAFTAVVMWWYAPLVPLNGRLGTGVQEIYGAVFVGRAVFAFSVGILAGAVLRRVVPAIGVTLVAWIAVVLPSITVLRPHLLAPVTVVNAPNTPSGLIISDVWKSPTGTIQTSSQMADSTYNAAESGHKLDAAQYLYQQGYVHTVVYQPASRFWTMQFIEAGGLAVLSAAFLITAVWLVRRRAA